MPDIWRPSSPPPPPEWKPPQVPPPDPQALAAAAREPFLIGYRQQMAALSEPVPATCTGLPHFVNKSEFDAWRAPQPNQTSLRYWWDADVEGAIVTDGLANLAVFSSAGVSASFGPTSLANTQVAGVAEADFFQTDGSTAFVVRGSELVMVRVYPVNEAQVLQRYVFNGTARSLLIDANHLAVITTRGGNTEVQVFARTPSSLVYLHQVSINGTYTDARAIGDHLFLVASYEMSGRFWSRPLPTLAVDGRGSDLKPQDVAYFDVSHGAGSLLMLLRINMSASDQPSLTALLADSGTTLYSSASNLYLTQALPAAAGNESTRVYKVPLRRGASECAAAGEVPGTILNRYSMDEFGGNLRVATTQGHVGSGSATAANLVLVMGPDMKLIGWLGGLAPGERIYSARFMGERLHLVTFKKVDPLFVINLSDPTAPSVMGYLKIPGFSEYLHPIGGGLLIGVGRDTVEAQTGNFAWFQGVKVSVFDVRDFEHPRELANLVIGDRGSWTPASTNPLAFTWIADRGEMVLPVHVFEVNRSDPRLTDSTTGREVWRGAYRIAVTQAGGLEVVQRIGINVTGTDGCTARTSGITRSFAVGGVLYTLNESAIEARWLPTGELLRTLSIGESPAPVLCWRFGD